MHCDKIFAMIELCFVKFIHIHQEMLESFGNVALGSFGNVALESLGNAIMMKHPLEFDANDTFIVLSTICEICVLLEMH